jgi:hypothetical protein
VRFFVRRYKQVLESLSSDEESEMEEVYNKLRALNRALDVAERI